MAKCSAPWLPDDAGEYASLLRRNSNYQTTIQSGRSDWIGLTFNNDLSKRILLDPKMRPVWKYLNGLGDDDAYWKGPVWKYFLIEVQIAAQGPKLRDLRPMSDVKSDISDLRKHVRAIKRVINRYNESEMTLWKLSPEFVQFKNNLKPDDEKKLKNNASVHVEALLDQIPKWISVNSVISPPLSSPNHPDAPYHFFVREVYSFFKVRDEKFNKWSLLARICNATGIFPLCDSNKARGTCRDLAQEFASPF